LVIYLFFCGGKGPHIKSATGNANLMNLIVSAFQLLDPTVMPDRC